MPGKRKILIPTRLDAIAKTLLETRGGYTVVQDDRTPIEALAEHHPDAYGMIVRSEKVRAPLLARLPALKVLIRAGAGYNTIDIQEARRRGVDVMNTPGANANAVAEEVLALVLADARHIIAADASCRKGDWEKNAFMGRELAGKTVGIVGLGAIGRLVARRLSGFECRLLGYDPMLSEDRARELDVELTALPGLFAQSDVVTLHVPENEETRGLVGSALLSVMKSGATLVNCARAGVVNEDALRQAKKDKTIRFLNDVYAKDEPGAKSVADLAEIMLPHLGASTVEANIQAARRAAVQLIEFDEKGISSFIVNRDIPEGLDPDYARLAFTLARLCRAVLGPETPLCGIETSVYGTLKPYARWLLVPIISALSDEFDRSSGEAGALQFTKDFGIEYQDRETDERKGYRNSLTVDLIVGCNDGVLRRASVRGTITEGRVMISRLNDFNKLYFEPSGPTVIFIYPDRPGVLGQIGAAMAREQINIDDVRNPHDSKGRNSVAILQVNRKPSEDLIRSVGAEIGAVTATAVEF